MEGVVMYKVELYARVRRACMVGGMSTRESNLLTPAGGLICWSASNTAVLPALDQDTTETGEPVTTSTTLRYQHDLDTRETQSRAPRLSAAALAERARSRNRRMESSTRGTRRYSTI